MDYSSLNNRKFFDIGFPDPFRDAATMYAPRDFRSALEWCEYLYYFHDGMISQAIQKVASYFIVDVEIESNSEDESKKWREYLIEELGILRKMQMAAVEYICYGNKFLSVLRPFRRFLRCPGCHGTWDIGHMRRDERTFRLDNHNLNFVASCPKCHVRKPFVIDDKDGNAERDMIVKRWSPKEIEIIHDPLTDQAKYVWRIPERYKTQLRQDHPFTVDNCNRTVLNAVRSGEDIAFHKEMIFHLKEPTLSGVENRGWGIPRILSVFRQIWAVQVYHRHNEAVALDYVIPFRLLTPAPRQSGASQEASDPLHGMSMGSMRAQVNKMLRKRRLDPASWHFLPYPVQQQLLGGDPKTMVIPELLDKASGRVLDGLNFPREMFNGSLTLQAVAPALRLFESSWRPMTHDLNGSLKWLVRRIADELGWEPPKAVRLQRPVLADDINRQMMLAQLRSAKEISGGTAYQPLGLDYRVERRRLMDEQLFEARLDEEMRQRIDEAGFAQQLAKGQDPSQQQEGGDQGAPQAAPPPVTAYLQTIGPNTKFTVKDMSEAAISLAQQLLDPAISPAQRRDQLSQLKQNNAVLHSATLSAMDQFRRQARNQGGEQVLAQGGAGAGV